VREAAITAGQYLRIEHLGRKDDPKMQPDRRTATIDAPIAENVLALQASRTTEHRINPIQEITAIDS